MAVPKYVDLFNPLLTALHQLGSSATIAELEQSVAQILDLSEEDLEAPHNDNLTKFAYNLAWARTYLKRFGLIENSARGVWALTAEGQNTKSVDKHIVKSTFQEEQRKKRQERQAQEDDEPEELGWESEALPLSRRCRRKHLKDFASASFGSQDSSRSKSQVSREMAASTAGA